MKYLYLNESKNKLEAVMKQPSLELYPDTIEVAVDDSFSYSVAGRELSSDEIKVIISSSNYMRQSEIASLTAYLTGTDWYATRFVETGKAIPEEILASRQVARDRISALKA